jgi:predicted RNA-binding Zn-ribbon protein involved in translation (DUF1610 family)
MKWRIMNVVNLLPAKVANERISAFYVDEHSYMDVVSCQAASAFRRIADEQRTADRCPSCGGDDVDRDEETKRLCNMM